MPRRSKEDALATRNSLLDAAERVFLDKGVAGTSLNDIALAAGTTRGAIYWHFQDKADLFNAMMDRVTLPLQDAIAHVDVGPDGDPVMRLRQGLRLAFEKTVHDPQTRRVFEVATQKVEYVASLCAVHARHLQVRDAWVESIRTALAQGARQRGVELAIPPEAAARGLGSLADGLLQNWLLDPSAFDLEAVGAQAVDTYLQGLGL